jgi:hypothetical protein
LLGVLSMRCDGERHAGRCRGESSREVQRPFSFRHAEKSSFVFGSVAG